MTFYHGSPIEIKEFNWNLTKNEVEQEGPGIYLTSSYDDAAFYGKYIYEVSWDPKKLLSSSKKSDVSSGIFNVLRLIKAAPNWKETTQNWDEEPEEGAQIAAEQFVESSDSFVVLYQFVSADFYRNNSIEFCKNISKLYDGFIIPKVDGIKHAIVFDPATIKIKKVHLIESKMKTEVNNILSILRKKVIKEEFDHGDDQFRFQQVITNKDLTLLNLEYAIEGLTTEDYDETASLTIAWNVEFEVRNWGIKGYNINIMPKIIEGEITVWESNETIPFNINVSEYNIENEMEFNNGTLYISDVIIDFKAKSIIIS